ncbi:MAG TPA: ribonuclease E/G, partial [Candidatus Acidoferrum sp.]|nr:ribonuclease E/G [Candidatus Acidoferrum sp.]
MSKELVISASSHERRVAILEEGQLVEIYIEREKEFALVGSIYKGKVTRVLPGMQSAFVDIGLDGDAFLYVSDVFENLEDYEPHEHHVAPLSAPAVNGSAVEVLPGETLARAAERHEESRREAVPSESVPIEELPSSEEAHATSEGSEFTERLSAEESPAPEAPQVPGSEEAQPESNASAPQNFSPGYNPTQNYRRSGNERQGQNYGRGGDRGRGGRWGRRGGRHRGGRPQGGPGGRNLPPSKYASPQGGEFRGYDNRGGQQRGGYDNRRQEGPRSSGSSPASPGEETIILPGESLAKYRDRPMASPAASPAIEQEPREKPAADEASARPAGNLPPAAGSPNVPRRFSGGLPSWLLADAAGEAAAPQEAEPPQAPEARQAEPTRNDVDLDDDQVAALAADLVEAKHEEATAEAEADAVVGGAVFDEEEESEEEETEAEAAVEAEAGEEAHPKGSSGLTEEEVAEVEASRAADRADFAADQAQEMAEHVAALGEHHEAGHEHAEIEDEESAPAESGAEEPGQEEPVEVEHLHAEAEVIAAASGEPVAEAAISEDAEILLPGETRAPRSGGPAPRREDFPRDSARIGGNPRSRFQRPFRSGGRGRDRGGRPDRHGGDRGRRFERRGPGGRHDRSHSGAPRRPQLISEMLRPGQDIVIQIAKEPLGKKGARITSHVALPGRFLVYMPTVHHTGVSRKIISAENRSRLRRLVSEASVNYPGGFIVRTAAGGASDDEIRTDIDFLGKTWNEIKQRSEERRAPALLHRDLDLVERMLRDYVSDDFTAIWIDTEEEYGKVVEFVSRFQPRLVNNVKLYTKETPIFEEFGIQHELDKALRAKVWLKSGGYIVINHTEALVAI